MAKLLKFSDKSLRILHILYLYLGTSVNDSRMRNEPITEAVSLELVSIPRAAERQKTLKKNFTGEIHGLRRPK